MKKVSIIIPAYNKGQYIHKAIISALCQKYENLEVVISDNCSPDNTREVVSEFFENKQVRYFRNETNLGRVANYRKALYEYATGDYVLMLDADDYLSDPDYISDAIKIFEQNENIGLVFAKQKVFFHADNSVTEDKINNSLPEIMDGNRIFLNYYKNFSICQLTVLYDRRKALEKGYYKENIISADVESTLRMLVGNKVGFINRFVGTWNKHGENASRTIDIKKIINNTRYIDSPYMYALSENIFSSNDLKRWRKKMLKKYFFKTLIKILLLKKNESSYFMSAIKTYDAAIHRNLTRDPRLLILKLISKSEKLLYFFIKDIIKLESFAKDLILYKQKCLKTSDLYTS